MDAQAARQPVAFTARPYSGRQYTGIARKTQNVEIDIYRKSSAKTERCQWTVEISDPHWNGIVVDPVDGETNDQRDRRIHAAAEVLGAVYKHGSFSFRGCAKNFADAESKILDHAAKVGIIFHM